VAGALRTARSIELNDHRQRALSAIVEARAEADDAVGAKTMIAALGPGERRGLELVLGVARARAGDPSLVLAMATGSGLSAEEAAFVLFGTLTALLRTPIEERDDISFWDLDVHPFR
jgi:hypothetical protein